MITSHQIKTMDNSWTLVPLTREQMHQYIGGLLEKAEALQKKGTLEELRNAEKVAAQCLGILNGFQKLKTYEETDSLIHASVTVNYIKILQDQIVKLSDTQEITKKEAAIKTTLLDHVEKFVSQPDYIKLPNTSTNQFILSAASTYCVLAELCLKHGKNHVPFYGLAKKYLFNVPKIDRKGQWEVLRLNLMKISQDPKSTIKKSVKPANKPKQESKTEPTLSEEEQNKILMEKFTNAEKFNSTQSFEQARATYHEVLDSLDKTINHFKNKKLAAEIYSKCVVLAFVIDLENNPNIFKQPEEAGQRLKRFFEFIDKYLSDSSTEYHLVKTEFLLAFGEQIVFKYFNDNLVPLKYFEFQISFAIDLIKKQQTPENPFNTLYQENIEKLQRLLIANQAFLSILENIAIQKIERIKKKETLVLEGKTLLEEKSLAALQKAEANFHEVLEIIEIVRTDKVIFETFELLDALEHANPSHVTPEMEDSLATHCYVDVINKQFTLLSEEKAKEKLALIKNAYLQHIKKFSSKPESKNDILFGSFLDILKNKVLTTQKSEILIELFPEIYHETAGDLAVSYCHFATLCNDNGINYEPFLKKANDLFALVSEKEQTGIWLTVKNSIQKLTNKASQPNQENKQEPTQNKNAKHRKKRKEKLKKLKSAPKISLPKTKSKKTKQAPTIQPEQQSKEIALEAKTQTSPVGEKAISPAPPEKQQAVETQPIERPIERPESKTIIKPTGVPSKMQHRTQQKFEKPKRAEIPQSTHFKKNPNESTRKKTVPVDNIPLLITATQPHTDPVQPNPNNQTTLKSNPAPSPPQLIALAAQQQAFMAAMQQQGFISALQQQANTLLKRNEQQAGEIAELKHINSDQAAELTKLKELKATQDAELAKTQDLIKKQVDELTAAKQQLERQLAELTSTKQQFEKQNLELTATKQQFENQTLELTTTKKQFENQTLELTTTKQQLDKQTTELADAKQLADRQTSDLEAARKQIDEQSAELEELREANQQQVTDVSAESLQSSHFQQADIQAPVNVQQPFVYYISAPYTQMQQSTLGQNPAQYGQFLVPQYWPGTLPQQPQSIYHGQVNSQAPSVQLEQSSYPEQSYSTANAPLQQASSATLPSEQKQPQQAPYVGPNYASTQEQPQQTAYVGPTYASIQEQQHYTGSQNPSIRDTDSSSNIQAGLFRPRKFPLGAVQTTKNRQGSNSNTPRSTA